MNVTACAICVSIERDNYLARFHNPMGDGILGCPYELARSRRSSPAPCTVSGRGGSASGRIATRTGSMATGGACPFHSHRVFSILVLAVYEYSQRRVCSVLSFDVWSITHVSVNVATDPAACGDFGPLPSTYCALPAAINKLRLS